MMAERSKATGLRSVSDITAWVRSPLIVLIGGVGFKGYSKGSKIECSRKIEWSGVVILFANGIKKGGGMYPLQQF